VSVVLTQPVPSILAHARAEERRTLLETEGYAVADALGFTVPDYTVVRSADAVDPEVVERLSSPRVVVKVLSPSIPHKTEVGGVRVTAGTAAAVRATIAAMEETLSLRDVAGYAVVQYVPHSERPGAQLLLGIRSTPDFGPVVTVGLGGEQTEFWAEQMREGDQLAVFAPGLSTRETVATRLSATSVGALVTGRVRGGTAHLSDEQLRDLVARLLAFAGSEDASRFDELEFNPVALTRDGPIVLDVLARLAPVSGTPPTLPRPLAKLRALLEPRSAAVIGVSEQRNPGRVIVENMLREGFPSDRLAVIKRDTDRIAGVRCFPSITALPSAVDLLVVSVAAPQVPAVVDEVVRTEKAESLIVIPGGLGERAGSEGLESRIRASLDRSRHTPWRGPVLNGGNCLGIRSTPGRYDTTFIPEYKLPSPGPARTPFALVSQSGAFAVARASRFLGLHPRYVISVGNQTDLTVGDYLEYLERDPYVRVVGCYVEAFRPGDGRRWLAAASEMVASGRAVVLYQAGRTRAGAQATVSHTASVAGDYVVVRELAEAAGVLVADTLDAFDDLVRLCCLLDGKQVAGMQLGAVSNAGFECVAFADRLGDFVPAPLSEATRERLRQSLAAAHLDGVVATQNPLDLTPITTDRGYEEAVRAVLEDETVDVAIVGCVPLTPALDTLPPDAGHGEDLSRDGGIVQRLHGLHEASDKAWVAVVDAGPLYDPMVERLRALGVPTFRLADRALRLFEKYCRHRLAVSAGRRPEPAVP
jgi:acyl-CoA synthetase (NDP forming)